MPLTINFDSEEYSSLFNQEWTGQWNRIGLEDLLEIEREGIETFLLLVASGQTDIEIDWNDLLLVQATEGGMFKNIYGPALSKDPNSSDRLILEVGANKFPVIQAEKGNSLKCGALEGTLSFSSKTTKITVKDADGDWQEIDYCRAWIDFMPADGQEAVFKVRCRLEPLSNPQPAAVGAAMRRGESIAKYFKPVSGSNSENDRPITLKMHEIGKGEFQVSGLQFVGEGQYGKSYIIHFPDGREVWARGLAKQQLEAGKLIYVPEDKKVLAISADDPLTLQIAKVEPKENGYSVDCVLRKRLPRVGKVLADGNGGNFKGLFPNLKKPAPTAALPAKKIEAIEVVPTAAEIKANLQTTTIDLDFIPF